MYFYSPLKENIKQIIMKNRCTGLFFCFLSIAILAQAQKGTDESGKKAYETHFRAYINDEKLTPREHEVDMKHLSVAVSFEPKQGLVKGTVRLDFEAIRPKVDSIFLDGPGIDFKKVLFNDKEVRYKSNKEGITIFTDHSLKWGEAASIHIQYEAHPRKGIYFIGWNDPTGRARKQIWTQGQGIDHRHWIPHFDSQNDKLTTELRITFESDYQVLSNGHQQSVIHNGDGTSTWHYKMSKPHPSYLIMLGIGKYRIKETASKSGVPMYFWYYPDWEDRVEATYRYSEQMMDFFEAEIGVPYPWNAYSQIPVQDYMHGAMENTTATVFGDFFCVDERSYLDRNYVAVNAHELAHQWFGDMVTARCAPHHWLQESFATHYSLLAEEALFGADHFNWGRRNSANVAIGASLKDKKPIAHSNAGTARWYPKGAVVLEMLKYVVGRDSYNRAVKYYLNRHGYQNVDSEDLLVAFHEVLGMSLNWFWDEWIYRGGEPHYAVTFEASGEKKDRKGAFYVKQAHAKDELVRLFKMPIWFEIHYKDGTTGRKKVWIENEAHEVLFDIPSKKKIDYVLFDPNSEVLKTVTFEKTTEMVTAQALKGEHMLDRYDALVEMRDWPLEQKQKTLLEVYKKENFHVLRAEVVSQLVDESDEKSRELIVEALTDKDHQVRKSAINHVDTIPGTLLAHYEKLLQDPSYAVVLAALTKLCKQYPKKKDTYLATTRDIIGTRGSNVRMKWLELAFESEDASLQQVAKKELIDRASPSYEFLTRNSAMQTLKRLDYLEEAAIPHLFDALFNPNRRLSGVARSAIKSFYQREDRRKMIDDYVEKQQTQWEDYQQKMSDQVCVIE